ncbi:MAG: hypothetical protein E7018_04275 [Alphaproteobacteria bacterium]|nr:hypothetical protein [Alphaproteobacteria bacterium]
MKHLFIALTILLSSATLSFAAPFKIVALVNGEVISSEDIQNRLNAFMFDTKIPFNDQTKDMIMQKVLNNAVDEKIKLQTATKEGITVTEEEVQAQLQRFEKGNKIPAGQLPKILKQAGVNPNSFSEQIKSDLAWIRVIRKKFLLEGNITQKEINEALAEAKQDLSTSKYMVAEIFIKEKNAKNISQLVENLRSDNRFELYAMQFSENPTAANGGNLGWVNKGKLAAPLEAKLQKMKPGDISDPIKLGDGYYILKLVQKFNPNTDKPQIPTEKEIKTILENRKMEALSKRLLQDLRQKAVIEIRG